MSTEHTSPLPLLWEVKGLRQLFGICGLATEIEGTCHPKASDPHL